MWIDFIRRHAEERPDKVAVIDKAAGGEGRRWTYAEMEAEILRWAVWFREQGVGRGDRVALLAANRLEHLTQFFACCKLGAIFVPLNWRLSVREIEEQLALLEPALMMAAGSSQWRTDAPCRDVDAIDLPPPPPPGAVDAVDLKDDDVLMILFTSGSTGTPKGVELHVGMLNANNDIMATIDAVRSDDVTIVNTPFFHTGGYNVFCLPILKLGGALLLYAGFEPQQVLEAIAEEGVSIFFGVPAMFQMIAETDGFAAADFASVRFVISGGAPLSRSLILTYQERGIPFRQGFGLTEVGPNCFKLEVDECLQRPDSVGRPLAHGVVRVVDDAGNDVGPGEVGELWMAGPHRANGYWRNRALFEASLAGAFFKTGDLVRVDDDGFFYVVGRKKEMYISGGENVYPGEVEKQILAHRSIIEAVVVGVPDPQWGEVGYAFYRGMREIDLSALRAFLNPRLSRYKHPLHLKRLESFPLLTNGKTDRKALSDQAVAAVSRGSS